MGLPAFDMSAFEAAQSAVTSKPRATTAVFLAPRLKSRRFVRGEIRRVEQMAKARAATYENILRRIREAKDRLDDFISSQALAAVSVPEEREKADYMQNALRRPADVEGVRERTARRLKQFPKTAAYLAR